MLELISASRNVSNEDAAPLCGLSVKQSSVWILGEALIRNEGVLLFKGS